MNDMTMANDGRGSQAQARIQKETIFDQYERQLEELITTTLDEAARARRIADYLIGPQPEAMPEESRDRDMGHTVVSRLSELIHRQDMAMNELRRQHQRLEDAEVFPG